MERSFEPWATVTPNHIVSVIARRLPSVAMTCIAVAFVVGVIAVFWPTSYHSDGLMYVRLGRAALSADPTAQNSNGVSLQESRVSGVVSVAEMVGSREIAARAVEKVGVRTINYPHTWIDRTLGWVSDAIPRPGGGVPSSMDQTAYDAQIAREEAIKRVQGWVGVSVPKDGYTVAVNGTANDPLLIQSVVQAILDEYKSYHVEAHSASGSLEFFEEQVSASKALAMDANKKFQDAKSKMGWMSVASAEATLQERIVGLETSYDDVGSQLADAKSQAKELERRLGNLKEWIPTEITKGIEKKAGADMRTELFELQVAQNEELAKLKPSHPKYRLMKQQLNDSQKILDAEGADREMTLEAINPVRQQLEADYQLAAAKAAGLESRQESLAKSLEKANKDLQRLNNDSITLSRLKWDSEIAEKNFLQHASSLEEARITAELDSQKLSDVSIIQNASLNLKKAGPPRLILMMTGVVLGLLLGFLQAILRDPPSSPRALVTETNVTAGAAKESSDTNSGKVLAG